MLTADDNTGAKSMEGTAFFGNNKWDALERVPTSVGKTGTKRRQKITPYVFLFPVRPALPKRELLRK